MSSYLVICLWLTLTHLANSARSPRPHIIFILADDLGFNDVSFHGSSQIPTPNIDALAYSGVILNNYYVNPICTPSRSALMTGKYPIHTGMQHTVLYAAEPRGLPLEEKLLPEYLQELGYTNHIVGKWHLGHYKRVYTPLYRGFDSHTGFWTGHQDYYDHTAVEGGHFGLDMRRNLSVAHDLHGQYTTDIITNESVRLIRQHNTSTPMFLYVAHAAMHSANPYNPLPAADADVNRFAHIENYNRRKYAAMLYKLDISVGEIVLALRNMDMLSNSIIVFSSDNGGPAEGFNLNAASNWPLRGVKNTLWEGGVRGAGLLFSPLLKQPQRVANQMMHIVDWLPTLWAAIGGDKVCLPSTLDGVNLWPELSENMISKRTEILHNIDDIWGSAALMTGKWKLVQGTHYKGDWDGWYGPSGNRTAESYNVTAVDVSKAGKALAKLKFLPMDEKIRTLRASANIDCSKYSKEFMSNSKCKPLERPCLFNLETDPCESYNLAEKYPDVLQTLLNRLAEYNATAVPPGNLPIDPRADPSFWFYTWTNFGDYSVMQDLANPFNDDELKKVLSNL